MTGGKDKELKGFMGTTSAFQVSGDEKAGATPGAVQMTSPAGGTSEQEPLLPLRLLVLAEVVARGEHQAGASAPEGPVRLDPQDFDALVDAFRPRIAIEVPSVVHGGQRQRVDLAIDGLKTFRPDGLLESVPVLRSLLEARRTLSRMQEGQLSAEQGRGLLERTFQGTPFGREVLGLLPGGAAAAREAAPAPAAPRPSAEAAQVSSILDMVDLDGTAEASAAPRDEAPVAHAPVAASTGRFDSILGQFIKSSRGASGGAIKPHEAIARVDRAIGLQVGAILQHPEVRRLEQVWRGLKLLSDRAQGVAGLQIDVLSVAADEAPAALRRVARRADVPVSMALVDDAIDGTAASFARLEALAEAAEGAVVPCVVSGTVGLLGVGDLSSIERLDHKGGLFTAPHRAPWRAVASKPALRWVSIAMNPLLARNAYDKQTSRVRELPVKEAPDDHEARVWMAPIWAIGVLVAKSFKETRWPCRITGARAGVVENLLVHQVEDGGTEVAVPTQAHVSTDSQREMARMGVLLVASAPNSDAAYVHSAPTAYVQPDKKTYDTAGATHPEARPPAVGLVDQLFLARLVQFTRALLGKIGGGASGAELAPIVEAAAAELFRDAPPAGPELRVLGRADAEGDVVQVVVRPRRFLGVQLEEIGFELPVG
jgi:type VI secretion system ImpB/VipA family protein